ncbi:MAG: hypothetical protein NWE94_09535 [Candidatus Bathyarchaeota archaeon]|nr:hypothetical protein [Candidatus Bathyarchaeota archaeon]
MAYLRKEKETVEIDYPLAEVWETIPKTLAELQWTIEHVDNAVHHIKARTQRGFISWDSTLLIGATSVGENTTRVSVVAETPVTTITSIVDFGRARRRIDMLFATLAKQLSHQPAESHHPPHE